MIKDPEIIKYLKGEAFTNTLNVELDHAKFEGLKRERIIVDLIKNSKVIHVGCTDHIQLINEKIEQNLWLHKLITDNAQKCIGIDIDREGIEYLKNNLGYTNVICGNVLSDELPELKKENWDFVVFGEIIEHLDDPVNFLKTFRQKFSDTTSNFILTVPNILTKNSFRNMLSFREVINSDHRYWFTPYTISKVLYRAGYVPEKIFFSNLTSLNFHQLIIRKIKQILGLKVEYQFYSFNTMIVSGRVS